MQRIAALVLLAFLAGCGEDPIAHYRIPKEKPPAPRPMPDHPAHTPGTDPGADHAHSHPPDSGPQRMIAAIVTHADVAWFFKLTGPDAAAAALEPQIVSFLSSVKFGQGEELTWTLPEGWRHDPGNGMRYATIRLGAGPDALELSVTPLGRDAGAILPNVNRWREQLGLPAAAESDLGKDTRPLPIDGETGTLVLLSSPGKASSGGAPPGSTGPVGSATGAPAATWAAPAGWQEVPATDGMKLAAFQVPDGDRKVEVSVMPLPGPAGGMLANVNRWRGQVGLAPLAEAELPASLASLEVDGASAAYVDLAGTDKRILGVILVRGDVSWFLKMQGPPDLVGGQKAAFESFARSFKVGTK